MENENALVLQDSKVMARVVKILMNAKKRGPASALNATARIHGVITNALDLLYMGGHDTCISECLFLLLFF
ncbi:unnamed protein product [Cuscuta campestris]|uniref:Uncharacterized protein n=1 Tax=Cuscuta campestris TaxID=132261 RepID=A0A484KQ82_9ASTE|nr:unnamed protein product [Cuscuta campestris]